MRTVRRKCASHPIPTRLQNLVCLESDLKDNIAMAESTYVSTFIHLLKDIKLLESVQRGATKWILNDYCMEYKSRLESLHLLPLILSSIPSPSNISHFLKKSYHITRFIFYN